MESRLFTAMLWIGWLLILAGVADAAICRGPRTGAICGDGTRSHATGSGACSHHRGVDEWITADKCGGLGEYSVHICMSGAGVLVLAAIIEKLRGRAK